jgi:hypothetical protein
MSRVTGVEYENRQNVTKSLKIAQKIEISAHGCARSGIHTMSEKSQTSLDALRHVVRRLKLIW